MSDMVKLGFILIVAGAMTGQNWLIIVGAIIVILD